MLSDEQLSRAVSSAFDEEELRRSAIYVRNTPVRAGERFAAPRVSFSCEVAGALVFVDLDRAANWGHACAYLYVGVDGRVVKRVDAQFPPATSADLVQHWHAITLRSK